MSERSAALAAARERLRRHGSEHLTDAEVLAILLTAGVRHREPLVVANDLLHRSGSIRALLQRPERSLTDVQGVGAASAARLSVALELGRRYLEGDVRPSKSLASPGDAAALFRARLGGLGHEVFACLFLDTRHRVISYEPMFRGTLDGTAVYPREVLKRALHHGAGAVILAHNHPSGDNEPSEADRSITARLKQALGLVDIRLLDHLIVSGTGHVSLAERGWV